MIFHKNRWPTVPDQTELSHRGAKPGQAARRRQPIPSNPTAAQKIAAITSKPRRSGDNDTQGEKTMNDPLIPLSHLALDVGATAAELATRLADEVLTDDLGRLAIDRDRARQLIAEHQTKLAASAAAERERAEMFRANINAGLEPTRRRVKALQEHQAALRASGEWDDAMSAYEVMCVGDHGARLTAAGDRFDQMLSAERRGELGHGYRLQPQKEN